MAAAAASAQQQQQQPSCCKQSSATSPASPAAFVTSCPAGQLEPLGLHQVSRPVSGTKSSTSSSKNKPSALDKHRRHVVLLQRDNRQQAQQQAAATQHKHSQRQRFADWGHRLRNAILHRGSQDSSTATHATHAAAAPSAALMAPAPAVPAAVTGAGDEFNNTQTNSSTVFPAAQHQHQRSDIVAAWKPVAAAAQTRELQETNAMQENLLRGSLPCVLDPDTLRPAAHSKDPQHTQQQQQHNHHQRTDNDSRNDDDTCAGPAQQRTAATNNNLKVPPPQQLPSPTAGTAAEGPVYDQLLLDDVDAFLDGLLQTATTTAATASATANAGTHKQAHATSNNASKSKPRTPTSHSVTAKQVPAWALSEQQAASAASAQAAEEEEDLLAFASELDWRVLLQDMGDDELAAAFKELEVAEAAAAEGQPGADKAWGSCFVTALNAAAMRGCLANSNAAAAGGGAAGSAAGGSQQGDKRSTISSASSLRRAEAAAARRQHLIQKLHSLTAATTGAVSPGCGAGSSRKAAPSVVCGLEAAGSTAASFVCGAGGGAAGGGSNCAGGSGWDSSTVVSSAAQDVGRLVSAIKHVEAEEVLGENPEMRGVHSAASVRSMLSRLEVQQ